MRYRALQRVTTRYDALNMYIYRLYTIQEIKFAALLLVVTLRDARGAEEPHMSPPKITWTYYHSVLVH